jgi:osmotically-inducible protein OsmY
VTRALKTDSDIFHDVARELAWDTRITPAEVGLQVKRGVVTLEGTVDSWVKVRAAEEAAHRVKGVLDVANDLAVRPFGPGNKTDTEIAEAVRRALEWDVMVPDQHIQSTVSHGTVRLAGIVSYWSQRADAERAIERLSGVKRVVNQIEVRPTEDVDMNEARHAVAKALERHGDRDESHIELHVDDGTVSVSGPVHTLHEKAAVLGAVRGTRGVRDVTDHLLVDADDLEHDAGEGNGP